MIRPVLALVAAVSFAGGSSAAWSDEPDSGTPGAVTYGLAPASAAGMDGRSFIVAGAAPGTVVHEHVAVINQSDVPLDLAVYAVDAGNGPDGKLGMAERGATADAGGWLAIESDQVTAPAQSSKEGPGIVIVPVTIAIPADAEPGDHVAGVVTSLTTASQLDPDRAGLQLEQRVGIRVYVNVKGEQRPAFELRDVRAVYAAGPLWGLRGQGTMTVTYTIVNTGNVRMAVDATTTVAGPGGLGRHRADGEPIAELVPGGSATQEVTVEGVLPLLYNRVTVNAVAGQAPGGVAVSLYPARASVFVWAQPWLVLVVLALVALAVWQWMRRRRRRAFWRGDGFRGRRGRAPAEPPTPPAPQPVASGVVPRSPGGGRSFTSAGQHRGGEAPRP